MKYLSYLIVFSLAFSSNALAQRKLKQLDDEEAQKQKQAEEAYGKSKSSDSKWVFGGNAGGGFGTGSSFILLQPIAGYKLLENTIVGGGATYIYSSFTHFGKKYSTSVYGPLLFARQNIFQGVFAQVEYQPLNYERFDNLNSNNVTPSRVWYQQLYVGGGYGVIPGAYIAVYYNVLFDQNNQLYNSPLDIRVGFLF